MDVILGFSLGVVFVTLCLGLNWCWTLSRKLMRLEQTYLDAFKNSNQLGKRMLELYKNLPPSE